VINSVISVAIKAGNILRESDTRDLRVSLKSRFEIVTSADLASEKYLKTALGEISPDAAFVGEESWNGILPDAPYWIVDPLDGTNNYTHGYPVYCVSIALWDGSDVVLGCIYDPTRNEVFHAEKGKGAFLNNQIVAVSETEDLSECILATGFPYDRHEEGNELDLSTLKYFLKRVQGIRRSGSAALDLSYVACGRLDGYWEETLQPWDMAAGVLLVREAGGTVTAFDGTQWSPRSTGIRASNGVTI